MCIYASSAFPLIFCPYIFSSFLAGACPCEFHLHPCDLSYPLPPNVLTPASAAGARCERLKCFCPGISRAGKPERSLIVTGSSTLCTSNCAGKEICGVVHEKKTRQTYREAAYVLCASGCFNCLNTGVAAAGPGLGGSGFTHPGAGKLNRTCSGLSQNKESGSESAGQPKGLRVSA